MKRAVATLVVILAIAVTLWSIFSKPLTQFKSPFDQIGAPAAGSKPK